MEASRWTEWTRAECAAIHASGRWRRVRDLDTDGPVATLEDGRRVVSFASNDYLGLTTHRAVVAAAHDALERWGTGAGASRLVVGSRPVHSALETELADWKGEEAALLFPTGFAANLGVLSTFATEGTLVCSDELNHASIVDGCRLARAAGARLEVYPHRDLAALEGLLATSSRAIVVTDSVFSMEGDLAPLAELTDVCARSDALLVLDEAHAVLGPEPDTTRRVGPRLRIGTLSKALGALGGFVAGPRSFIELLVNRARPFIFSTAPTPADTAAASAALGVVRSTEGLALRARLARLVERVAPGHPSPILPVVFGEEAAAVAASRALLDSGILVPAIRPPSVPPGTSRLRVALSAAHRDEHVDRLVDALAALDVRQPIGA